MGIKEELGKKIKRMRVNRGLTQEQLAEKLEYSPNHISKLESARTNPSFELLVSISKVLDIEIKELFNFDEYQTTTFIKKEFDRLIQGSEPKKLKLLYKIYRSIDS